MRISPCLSVVGMVTSIIMIYYCIQLIFIRRGASRFHGQVAIAIIASLAMWDSEVAERFAREDLQTIFHPLPFLIDMAAEQGMGGRPGLLLV